MSLLTPQLFQYPQLILKKQLDIANLVPQQHSPINVHTKSLACPPFQSLCSSSAWVAIPQSILLSHPEFLQSLHHIHLFNHFRHRHHPSQQSPPLANNRHSRKSRPCACNQSNYSVNKHSRHLHQERPGNIRPFFCAFKSYTLYCLWMRGDSN